MTAMLGRSGLVAGAGNRQLAGIVAPPTGGGVPGS